MSQSSILINGYPVVLDVDASVQQFLDRYYCDDGEIFKRHELPLAKPDLVNRSADATWCKNPYPDLPTCKLSQLIWPSGASRYARALFLVDRVTMLAIAKDAWGYEPAPGSDPSKVPDSFSAFYPKNLPLRVVFRGEYVEGLRSDKVGGGFEESDVEQVFEAEMFALAPLQVPADNSDLFVLPLVDRRFFAAHGALNISRVHDYREMVREVASNIGLPARMGQVSADYGTPDPMLQETVWPACNFIDVMALSLGTRAVFHPLPKQASAADGLGLDVYYQLDLQSPAIAAASRNLNLKNAPIIAGGDLAPSGSINSVLLWFWNRGQHVSRFVPMQQQYHSFGSTPINVQVITGFDMTHLGVGAINNLENTIHDALWEWKNCGGLRVFQGPIAYEPSGFDDYFSIECKRVDGCLVYRSTISELPPVFLPSMILPNSLGGTYRYELAEDWSDESLAINDAVYARAKIRRLDGGPSAEQVGGSDEDPPEGLPYVYDIYQKRTGQGEGRKGLAVKLGRHLYAIDEVSDTEKNAFMVQGVLGSRPISSTDPKQPYGAHADERAIAYVNSASLVNLSPAPYTLFIPFSECANPHGLNGLSGDPFIAVLGVNESDEPQWQLIAVLQQKAQVFFRLTANRGNGQGAVTVNASVRAWRGHGSGPTQVVDRYNVAVNAKTDHEGIAEWNQDRNEWTIIECQHFATDVRGTTGSPGPGGVGINFTPALGYDGPVQSGGPFLASNLAGWEYPGSGKLIWCKLNPVSGAWEVYQLECAD